jgi:catechol 2,3-dioxygenase
MPVQSIGHAVLKVSNIERAEAFYCDVLGLPVATRWDGLGRPMTFFTLGNHHDLAIVAMGDDAAPADPRGVGLAHVAFKVGESDEELLEMRAQLERHGWPVDRAVDHGVTHSLYVSDPDGNGIELYVDVDASWRTDPRQIVATYRPLTLQD